MESTVQSNHLNDVAELRARLDLLEATNEQLRYALSQLARENHGHHVRTLQMVRNMSWRHRAVQFAGELWPRMRRRLHRLLARPAPVGETPAAADTPFTAAACPSACFFGDGFSGSWMMRSLQVAQLRKTWHSKSRVCQGWHRSAPKYQIFVFVKRFDAALARRLRAGGVCVVYDLVDFWKQPDDGLAHPTLPEVIQYFRGRLENLPVDGVIFPNATMEADLGRYVPNPVTIYHHHRIGLPPIQVRRRARIVAYEGEAQFLGPWAEIAQRVCERLGLVFAINPPSLADADIGFAARGGPHGSLMAQRYKSNVKMANFYAAGLPCIVHENEMAYHETGNQHVRYFASESELEQQLRGLLPYEARVAAHLAFLEESKKYRLEAIAEQYEAYFRRLLNQPRSPAARRAAA